MLEWGGWKSILLCYVLRSNVDVDFKANPSDLAGRLAAEQRPGAPVDIEINFDSNHSTFIRLIYLDIKAGNTSAQTKFTP